MMILFLPLDSGSEDIVFSPADKGTDGVESPSEREDSTEE